MSVEITIDGKKVEAPEGARLLDVALAAGFYIPHLCAHAGIDYYPASCRLCYVEIEGIETPVTSCTTLVKPGMVVKTRSEAVDRLIRTGFELIMSTHRLNCKDCPANKKCELQNIARQRKLPLKPKRIPKIEPDYPIDESHPRFGLDPNHCVLCGRCVHVCNHITHSRALDFKKRGLKTVVGTFSGKPLGEIGCDGCDKCVEVCPVGALYLIADKKQTANGS